MQMSLGPISRHASTHIMEEGMDVDSEASEAGVGTVLKQLSCMAASKAEDALLVLRQLQTAVLV